MEFQYQLDAYARDTCTDHQTYSSHYYSNFLPVSDFRNFQAKCVKMRLVVFMKGPQDGYVLLSSSPNLEDPNIEIGKFCVKKKYAFIKICSTIEFISNLN